LFDGCRYTVHKKIASGGFGDVFVATMRSTPAGPNAQRALKRYRSGEGGPSVPGGSAISVGICASAVREIANLRAVGEHPHIVTLRDVGFASKRPFAVLDLFPTDLLHAASALSSSERQRWAPQIAAQLASALAHLDSLCIVHRDVKMENVLCRMGIPGEGMRVCLCDLGGSRYAGSDNQRRLSPNACLTVLAPEAVSGGTVDHKSDIFCMAVCIAEFVALRQTTEADLVEPANLANLAGVPALALCFEKNPSMRPRAGQLLTLLEVGNETTHNPPEIRNFQTPNLFANDSDPMDGIHSLSLSVEMERAVSRAEKALIGSAQSPRSSANVYSQDRMCGTRLRNFVRAAETADKNRRHEPELTVAAAAVLLGKYAEDRGTEVVLAEMGYDLNSLSPTQKSRIASMEWAIFASVDFNLLPYFTLGRC
jgi:serine/threonine protein kinase